MKVIKIFFSSLSFLFLRLVLISLFVDEIIHVTSQYANKGEEQSCCCGRAMYRVTFQGFWKPEPGSRLDPERLELRSGWRGLVGASHSGGFSLFQQDKMAPPHLRKEISQEMVTATFLENHLKQNQFLRTVIRMPDLQRGEGVVSGQMGVTPSAHFISFFASMYPTTDWFAGTDSVSLCSNRCVWTREMDLDLGLFDAGTHEPTWEAPSVFQVVSRQREVGATISLLTSSGWSSHGGAGGVNKDNEAGGGEGGWEWFRNPMARLLLRRTAVLGNDTCRQSNEAVDPNKPFPNVQCQVTEWSDWSACSCEESSCPNKYRYRQRRLVQPQCCDHLPPQACQQAVGHTNERQVCKFISDDRT
ncbi:spondin-2-like isoform X2 [Symsagittifera roscoffensis]|uniref:spondin-2-like isoform X2 n=1 Tax=Symsagittifera roscoffensis TaxID=84072 RepID=UPI00307BBF3F